MMRRHNLASIFAALLIAVFSQVGLAAAAHGDEDTDTRLVDAQVVEVSDARIAVIARTGVEHVIAIDSAATKVMINGQFVSLKDVREGDVVTVELDEQNPVKFASNISIAVQSNSQVAGVRP